MTFLGNADYNGLADINVRANDGQHTTDSVIQINLSPVNDAPRFTGPSAPLTANEGGSVSFDAVVPAGEGFTQNQLGLTEADNSPEQVIFKITDLDGLQGVLILHENGVDKQLTKGSTLSAAQLGSLRYVHDGSQVTADTIVGFTVNIDDGAGGLLMDQTIQITLKPVNQAPTVGGAINIVEGQQNVSLTDNGAVVPGVIDTERGGITVADADDHGFTYTIAGLPTHGTLYYDGQAITDSNFAFDDLSKLTYSHDGTEPDYGTDQFDLIVTDSGGGAGTPLSTTKTIVLNILPNDNEPVLVHNVEQTVGGSGRLTIDDSMLLVTDTDSLTITYTVTGVPDENLGYFTRDGLRMQVGSTFTQADIDNGLIAYVSRTASAEQRTDVLTFTVQDGDMRYYPTLREGGIYTDATGTTLQQIQFKVIVPPATGTGGTLPDLPPAYTGPKVSGSAHIDVVENNSGADVITITSNELQATDDNPIGTPANLTYRLLTVPTGGVLLLNGKVLNQYDSFTQLDIDQNRVQYRNSGGEDFIQSFEFSVSDGATETGTKTFSIRVTPQNDTPTASLGPRPPAVSEGGTVVIDNRFIVLSDSDDTGGADPGTPYAVKNGLSFVIEGNVSHGKLYLNGGEIGVGAIVSAADLAAGKLVYVHDGSETVSDAFVLKPVDDQGVPAGSGNNQSSTGAALTVNIIVNPINDAPVYESKTEATGANAVYEGGSVVIWGDAGQAGPVYLKYSDTDNSEVQRQYRIVEAPAHGRLMLNGVVLGVGSVFTQADLDGGKVKYVHDGTDTRDDYFDYVVSDGDWSSTETDHKQQGQAITAARFNFEIKPINDAPAVTGPTTPINIGGDTAAENPIPGFSVDDRDLGSDDGDDFFQVTVRLLDSAGNALSAADYQNGGSIQLIVTGLTPLSSHDGNGDYLVFQGTRAEVNAALASLRVLFPNDNRNAQYQVQVIVDDRMRDASGALIPAMANGGDANQAGSLGGTPAAIPATELDGYQTVIPDALKGNVSQASVTLRVSQSDEAPTLTTPGAVTADEDAASFIGGDFTIVDPESTNLDLPIRVTLQVAGGFGSLGVGGGGSQDTVSINGRTVKITGDNTGTLVLEGRADDIQDLLNDAARGLTFKSATNDNADRNGGADGDVTIQVSLDEADAAVGERTGGEYAPARDIAVTINPTNDAPAVSAGSGTIVADEAGKAYAIDGVQVADPDIPDGTSTDPGETNVVLVTVRLLDQNGNPLQPGDYAGITLDSAAGAGAVQIVGGLNGAGTALAIQGDIAAVNAYLAQLRIKFDPAVANADKAYTIQVIVDDRAHDADGKVDGSGNANGGRNLDGTGAGTTPVPTANVDAFAALPAGLAANVAVATRSLFVSGVNDPARIDADDIVTNETAGVIGIPPGAITVTDADSIGPDGNPGNNLSVTIRVSKGAITSAGDASLGGTVSALGGSSITITGLTLAQLNARIAALQITAPADEGPGGSVDWNGSFQLTIEVNDGGNSGQRPGVLDGDSGNPNVNPGDYQYHDGDSAALITKRVINVTVNPVNDAPTRSDGNPVTLPAVDEDTAAPPGATVGDLFGGKFRDVRDDVENGSAANAFAGIAITANGATPAQGTWEYSTDGGATWQAIPAVSVDHAFLLAATDRLRFVPAGDYAGTPGSLQARLVDSSTALAHETFVDLSGTKSGGTTPYSDSNNTVTLNTAVTPRNDAPTLSQPGAIVVREDAPDAGNTGSTVDAILGGFYSDARDDQSGIAGGGNDASAFQGIVILGNTADPAAEGRWEYRVGSGAWTAIPTGADLSGGMAIYLPKDASLRFNPVTNYHGAPPALTVAAVDGSGGARTAVEERLVIPATGGSTPYSAPSTIRVTVLPVNDAPDIAGLESQSPVAVKGGAAVRLDADGDVDVSDVELDASGNWQGATLTIQRNGGANADDVFGWAADRGVTRAGATLFLDGVAIGTVTGGAGIMTVTFTATVDAAMVGRVMGAVTYRNTDASTAASPAVRIDFTLDDQNVNDTGGGVAGSGQDQGEGGKRSVTKTVEVRIDTPPVAAALPDRTGQDSQAVAIDTAGAFNDPDGDTLTYTASGLPPSLSIDAQTGRITGTLGRADSQGGPDGDGAYTVTVTATDADGGSTSQTFRLTVRNPGPVAQDDTGSTDADTPLTGDVIAGADAGQADSDPDGDTLTVVQVNGSAGSVGHAIAGSAGGTFILNADGSYTFDPGDDFNDVPQGQTRTTSISYAISDGEGGTATATLTITVTGLNAAPTVDASLPDRTGIDSEPVNIPTASGFTDVDIGDVLTYSASGLPEGLSIDAATGVITGTLTHSASQGGGANDGVYTITVTATDLHGASVSQSFTLTVGNPAPVARDDTGQTDSSTIATGDVIAGANAGEADSDPDGDALTVIEVNGDGDGVGRAVAGDQGGRFVLHADGTYTFDPNGDFADLDAGQTRTTSVTYRISDGQGGVDTAVLTITVHGLNDPPVARPDVGRTDAVTPISGDAIAGADPSQADDDPEGESVAVVEVNGDAANLGQAIAGSHGGRFVLNADGSYTFDPNGDFTGLAQGETATTQIRYTIADGHGQTSTATITVTVVGVNEAPASTGELPGRSDLDAAPGIRVDVSHAFADIDGDALSYAATGLPPGMTIDPRTGLITGTMDRSASAGGQGGRYTVSVTATDPHGASVTRSFVWEVRNPAPQAAPDTGTTRDDTPLQGNVLPNDHDPDGDPLAVAQFSVAGDPAVYAAGQTAAIANAGSLTLNRDGSYTFVPVKGYAGDVPLITYRVGDGEGGVAASTLQISVTRAAANVPPPPAPWTPSAGGPSSGGSGIGLPGGSGGDALGDDDDDDDGVAVVPDGGARVEYWAVYPDTIRLLRHPAPALFVTHAVQDSQQAIGQRWEPASVQSQTIAMRMAAPTDLHVVRAVGASQRHSLMVERHLTDQRINDAPGANPLFDDFDALALLAAGAAPQGARPAGDGAAGKPAHAPSFTQQLHQASGARPARAATPAPAAPSRQ
ncbi:cadherin-like domain-containing protein [Bordetella genomosp. 9]|uniref:Dystroglycan-type cadherin-like domain-containing protein n=1 Tax=Bordetella genomosp. 9 TaxID=1416803 RepID=A0A1W6Z0K2_9BORD|nr:Ig-like domain-containing protein [Bordetella genomosp. 9]ARP86724.1 hypothetical protein CAL13_11275 [Bordetella genomosp. 9]